MDELKCRLLVIGAGPGGYVCAIRAGQLGVDTIIVEKEVVGGTCLNVGCIPSKALIHAGDAFAQAMENASGNALGIATATPKIDLSTTVSWKNGVVKRLTSGVSALLKRAKVRQITGAARFVDGKTVDIETKYGVQRVRAEYVVIATGSSPVELPQLPFGGNVMSSTQALALTEVPKSLAVVGAGYIGLEIGIAYRKLGAKVTVVELGDRILPQYDEALTAPVAERLGELDIEVLTNASADGMAEKGKGLKIRQGDQVKLLKSDKILVTVGRRPAVEGWGLDQLSLEMDGRFIRIDETCKTTMRGIYAVGDVTGEPMLAHRAMAQGAMVAEIVAGGQAKWDKEAIPAVCFVDPEIVTVGLSPDAAIKRGIDTDVALFPFAANGRALTAGDEKGFVRMVCRKQDGLVLGVQAVGQGVSEFSATFALALEMGATAQDVAATIHAHPTRGEAFQEVALRVLGKALHI